MGISKSFVTPTRTKSQAVVKYVVDLINVINACTKNRLSSVLIFLLLFLYSPALCQDVGILTFKHFCGLLFLWKYIMIGTPSKNSTRTKTFQISMNIFLEGCGALHSFFLGRLPRRSRHSNVLHAKNLLLLLFPPPLVRVLFLTGVPMIIYARYICICI